MPPKMNSRKPEYLAEQRGTSPATKYPATTLAMERGRKNHMDRIDMRLEQGNNESKKMEQGKTQMTAYWKAKRQEHEQAMAELRAQAELKLAELKTREENVGKAAEQGGQGGKGEQEEQGGGYKKKSRKSNKSKKKSRKSRKKRRKKRTKRKRSKRR